jgi:type IV pilus assembly protein PilM
VVDAARRLIKKSGTKAKNVAMALPASLVISKKIILPGGLSERELEAQVELEANQYIPFSLDEVSLDFCVIGPSPSSAGDVEVMIAASRKEKVEDRQGLAEAIGLTPMVMDVESYASRLAAAAVLEQPARWRRQCRGGPVRDRWPVLHPAGAARRRVAVRARPGVWRRAADPAADAPVWLHRREAEAKKRANELPEDYAQTVLAPFVQNLAQEVERALKFFFTSTPHNRVDMILLAGGSAGLHGLTEAITEATSFRAR